MRMYHAGPMAAVGGLRAGGAPSTPSPPCPLSVRAIGLLGRAGGSSSRFGRVFGVTSEGHVVAVFCADSPPQGLARRGDDGPEIGSLTRQSDQAEASLPGKSIGIDLRAAAPKRNCIS